MASSEDFKRIIELYKPLADMERQDFINTITELKAMKSSLKLTIATLSSSNDKFAERYDRSLQKSKDRLQCAYGKVVKKRNACLEIPYAH